MRRLGKRCSCWLLAILALGPCGCQDTDRLARVGRLAASKVERLTGGLPGRLANGWQTLWGGGEESLDTRVATRLRWDKTLAQSQIQVHVNGGVVELRGTVVDEGQRRRAEELATATMGVERVANVLLVVPTQTP